VDKKGDTVTCEYTVRDFWVLCISSFWFDTLVVIRTSARWRMVMRCARSFQGWIRMDVEENSPTEGAILICGELNNILVIFRLQHVLFSCASRLNQLVIVNLPEQPALSVL
jgi:hypothetical protein